VAFENKKQTNQDSKARLIWKTKWSVLWQFNNLFFLSLALIYQHVQVSKHTLDKNKV